MSIKSIQKKLQLQSLHSISINYIQKTSENILWHPKCNELQLAGLASQISSPAADQRFFEVSRKFTRIGSRLQGMDHGYPWMGIVEICWNLLNQVRQVESNDSLPLEHSGTPPSLQWPKLLVSARRLPFATDLVRLPCGSHKAFSSSLRTT